MRFGRKLLHRAAESEGASSALQLTMAYHKGSGAVAIGICVGSWVALATAPVFLKSWQRAPEADDGKRSYAIGVNVDLVVLQATVRDPKRRVVPGLSEEDFRVYEDGVPQRIQYFSHEDVPVTVGLVVDNSGSMSSKRPEVVVAGLAFARSSNPQDEIFVVDFNERVWMGLPEGLPFTSSINQLDAALSGNIANGRTALYDAIATALAHLKLGHPDKKVLLVISDGGDNASRHSLRDIMTMAGHSNAIIYTIGIFDQDDTDRDPRVLKQLAKATGGGAFLPESRTQLAGICEQIAKAIRNQYTIAYLPTNKMLDGSYRSIRLTAVTPAHRGLIVQTRTGYYAPSSAGVAIPAGAN